jgi:hypothetical protein
LHIIFGLSEAKGRSMSLTRTALVSSGFTVPWTAPELLQGDAKALASDVFLLGVTLWEIFERATPFGHLAEVVVITQLLNGQRPTLTNRTPPKVAHLIAACWSQDAKRGPPADRVAFALQSMMMHH